MSTEVSATEIARNVEVVKAFHEAFNRRDFAGALALFADEWEWVHLPDGETFQGSEGLLEAWNGWQAAMPDVSVEIRNLVASGEWVVAELWVRGTQTGGPMMASDGPIPPSGRAMNLQTCDVVQFQDGKMVYGRSYYDEATIRSQLEA